MIFNLIISRLSGADYSLQSSAWRRTHFSLWRTLLLHPSLPLQGLSTSWKGIWKLADNKAFLPALCSYFKPTLILCPPAEKWLLEEAASPWEELAKVSVKELVPSCLFSCLSQASVEAGKPFPWPCPCSSFLFPQPWQRSWREGKWNSLCLETFSELLHLLSSAGSLFVCVLKPPQMLSQPFILLRFPCWPPEQLSPWPLQPLMPTSWSASAQWQNPTLQTQAVLTENLMGPKVFRVGKPGEENAEFASPSPTVPGLGAPLLWLYWEVTPRRNILQFLMGMKANCNLQLNSSFCF